MKYRIRKAILLICGLGFYEIYINGDKDLLFCHMVIVVSPKFFLERDMDYFILETEDEVNAKATELIMKDQ